MINFYIHSGQYIVTENADMWRMQVLPAYRWQ